MALSSLLPTLQSLRAGRFTNYSCLRRISLAYTLQRSPASEAETQSEPLVLLHGLFGSKKNYQSISKVLARDLSRPVYALDLRNHGDSPHDPTHNYVAMASDVEEFIQDHHLKKTILEIDQIKRGAKVAMTLALRSPDLVEALVAVDNAPVQAVLESDFSKYVLGMQQIEKARVSRQVEADAILKSYETSLPIRQFLLTNIVRPSGTDHLRPRIPLDILASSIDGMGGFPFEDPGKVQYEGPTLFIRGTRSRYVSDDILPLVMAFFPKFQIRDIDSGHWVISEQPKAFIEAVVKFLS